MKVLVTLDGSRESEAILPAVVALAKASQAALTLFRVLPPAEGQYLQSSQLMTPQVVTTQVETVLELPNAPAPVVSEDQAIARATSEGLEYLRSLAAYLTTTGGTVSVDVASAKDISAAIVEYAVKNEFDIIAMSTHGRSGLNSLIHGSVANAVVRAGARPVLLVRPGS